MLAWYDLVARLWSWAATMNPSVSAFSPLLLSHWLVLWCIIIIIINNNAVRKKEKYVNLINEMSRNYRCVRFVNLSMSSLGVFSDECSTFLDMN